MAEDAAETGRIAEALGAVGAALDRFCDFRHADAQHPGADWRRVLDQPLPAEGAGLDTVLREIAEVLVPNGAAVARPGFSAWVTTGPVTSALAAATATMLAAPQRQTLHAFNFLEELSLDWLAQLFGLPARMKGVYSSGGSVANLLALGAARQWALEQAGIDPAAEGMGPRCALYATTETHHTVRRAAGVLGIGRNNVVAVACGADGRMLPEALEQCLARDRARGIVPVAVIGNAGTTNTGAIDPLAAIARVAQAHGAWFHVDGAYGLPGILDPRKAPLYAGLEFADSVIVDPHKWLGAPVGVGATFVRDRQLLHRAFTQEPAAYLEGAASATEVAHSMHALGIPWADFSVELSAQPRGAIVWALIREIGVEGLRERIVRHNDMAARIAARVRAEPRLELLCEPVLSICCFRHRAPAGVDADEFNRVLQRRLVEENEHLPSTTVVGGKLAIRPCFVGARSGMEHADALVDAVLRIGASMH